MLFKFGDFDLTPYIKAGSYECTPNERKIIDEWDDADKKHHVVYAKHTSSTVSFSVERRSEAMHKQMMDGITSNYLDYSARDANCEYYDTESCTIKSGHFRLDPSARFVVERDNGKKKFAESAMTFIEY